MPGGRGDTSGQFWLLFGRYFKVKMRDASGTAIMLLQAPIIGVLLALVFGGQKDAIPYWCLGALQELARKSGGVGDGLTQTLNSMQSTPDHAGSIFFVVVAAVWFGTSNAAREIVSERAIYMRERMVNLGLFNYVFSKFVLLSLFCVVQCTILLAIVFFSLGYSGGIVGLRHLARHADRHGHELGGHRSAAEHARRQQRGRHGAHAHRAHPAGRAGRLDGADDHQLAARMADVLDARALGLSGRRRPRAARHLERSPPG